MYYHNIVVIKESLHYEFQSVSLNRLLVITIITDVTDITCFGHDIWLQVTFVQKSVSLGFQLIYFWYQIVCYNICKRCRSSFDGSSSIWSPEHQTWRYGHYILSVKDITLLITFLKSESPLFIMILCHCIILNSHFNICLSDFYCITAVILYLWIHKYDKNIN